MTALQLNADICRNLAILSQDESMLEKAAKSLRRLAKQMTEDPTYMSKEEFFARLEHADARIDEGHYVEHEVAKQHFQSRKAQKSACL